MFYTIKSAMSGKNPGQVIDLSKNGNEYVCSVWHMGEHRTLRRFSSQSYEEADAVFSAWCTEGCANTITTHTPDWDATDFD